MKEAFVCATLVIPEMTHRLSKYWEQPKRDSILISETSAIVHKRDMQALAEYSATNPSGVYEGKMWKRNLQIPNGYGRYEATDTWFLCWYGRSNDPDRCSINIRTIV